MDTEEEGEDILLQPQLILAVMEVVVDSEEVLEVVTEDMAEVNK